MKTILFSIVMFISVNVIAQQDNKMELKAGDKAPDFKLKDDAGKMRTLSEFLGKKWSYIFIQKMILLAAQKKRAVSGITTGCSRKMGLSFWE